MISFSGQWHTGREIQFSVRFTCITPRRTRTSSRNIGNVSFLPRSCQDENHQYLSSITTLQCKTQIGVPNVWITKTHNALLTVLAKVESIVVADAHTTHTLPCSWAQHTALLISWRHTCRVVLGALTGPASKSFITLAARVDARPMTWTLIESQTIIHLSKFFHTSNVLFSFLSLLGESWSDSFWRLISKLHGILHVSLKAQLLTMLSRITIEIPKDNCRTGS